MAIYRLTEHLYIAPQLQEGDLDAVRELGIRTLVCNRPDGEDPAQQPDFADISAKLADSGIQQFVHLPTTMPAINAELLAQFKQAVSPENAPVLAYCRTGTRSSLLWAMNQAAQGASADALIAQVQAATGIDLSAQYERIKAAENA